MKLRYFNFPKQNIFASLVFSLIILSNSSIKAQSFDKSIFEQRRADFMDKMDNGVAIFISPEVSNRNDDVDYKYRQNSDFYYLTGYEEPNSIFILSPESSKEFIMFLNPKDPMREMWTGEMPGVKDVMEKYGADTVLAYNDFHDIVTYYLYGKEKIYYDLSDEKFNDEIAQVMNYSRGAFPKVLVNPSKIVHTMRIIKSQEEIDLMQKAIDITCEAQLEAFKNTKVGKYEYEIKALIEYIFAKNNSPRVGFPSIVASGPNSTVLHYEKQYRKMLDGDLLLMDIGAEYGYYSADVTRTIPVNGKFSAEQKEIYNVVLDIQEKGIYKLKKGTGINTVTSSMIEQAKQELYRIGLVTDKNSEWQWRLWYFPYTCHWLGLNVHDVQGDVSQNESGVILQPGMVTTIEPGIYINPDNLENIKSFIRAYRIRATEEEINNYVLKVKPIVQKYANIGIRIEDDVLITQNGHKVLSEKAPKTIEDIENIMKK